MARSNADVCRERSWKPGDVVETQGEMCAFHFVITAIGQACVLVRQIGFRELGQEWSHGAPGPEMVAGFGFEGAWKVN